MEAAKVELASADTLPADFPQEVKTEIPLYAPEVDQVAFLLKMV